MALPLLFFIGSSIVRAATPTIARLLVKQGYKRASSTVVKNTLKTAKKIRTIGKKKDIPIAKSKSLTVPKNQSTALTKINKVTGGGKSSNVGGKVIAGGVTVISGAAALSTDKKKGDAKAESSKKKGKVDVGLQEALKKKTTTWLDLATQKTYLKAHRNQSKVLYFLSLTLKLPMPIQNQVQIKQKPGFQQ